MKSKFERTHPNSISFLLILTFCGLILSLFSLADIIKLASINRFNSINYFSLLYFLFTFFIFKLYINYINKYQNTILYFNKEKICIKEYDKEIDSIYWDDILTYFEKTSSQCIVLVSREYGKELRISYDYFDLEEIRNVLVKKINFKEKSFSTIQKQEKNFSTSDLIEEALLVSNFESQNESLYLSNYKSEISTFLIFLLIITAVCIYVNPFFMIFYIVLIFFMARVLYLTQKIIITNEYIQSFSFINSKKIKFSKIKKIELINIPKSSNGRFPSVIPALQLNSNSDLIFSVDDAELNEEIYFDLKNRWGSYIRS